MHLQLFFAEVKMASFFVKVEKLKRCATLYMKENSDMPELWSMPQTYILILCRTPGISQEELARTLLIDKSSVTRHLARLEGMGYVERHPSESDKRVTLVYPTKKAYEAMNSITSSIQSWNDYLLGDFTPDEKEQFLDLFNRVIARADRYAANETYIVSREDDKK